MINVCEPTTEIQDIQTFIKQNTGADVKLTRKEACEVYSDIKYKRLPLPPMSLSRDKTHLVDVKMPVTFNELDYIFKSKTSIAELKRIARKIRAPYPEKPKKSEVLKGIHSKLRSLGVMEPIRITKKRVIQMKKEKVNKPVSLITNEKKRNVEPVSVNTNENNRNVEPVNVNTNVYVPPNEKNEFLENELNIKEAFMNKFEADVNIQNELNVSQPKKKANVPPEPRDVDVLNKLNQLINNRKNNNNVNNNNVNIRKNVNQKKTNNVKDNGKVKPGFFRGIFGTKKETNVVNIRKNNNNENIRKNNNNVNIRKNVNQKKNNNVKNNGKVKPGFFSGIFATKKETKEERNRKIYRKTLESQLKTLKYVTKGERLSYLNRLNRGESVQNIFMNAKNSDDERRNLKISGRRAKIESKLGKNTERLEKIRLKQERAASKQDVKVAQRELNLQRIQQKREKNALQAQLKTEKNARKRNLIRQKLERKQAKLNQYDNEQRRIDAIKKQQLERKIVGREEKNIRKDLTQNYKSGKSARKNAIRLKLLQNKANRERRKAELKGAKTQIKGARLNREQQKLLNEENLRKKKNELGNLKKRAEEEARKKANANKKAIANKKAAEEQAIVSARAFKNVNAAKAAIEKRMKSNRTDVDKTFRRMMLQYHPNKTGGNDHNSKMLSSARNALKMNVQKNNTVKVLQSPKYLSEAKKLVSTSVPWLKRGRWTQRIGRAENNPVELRKIVSNLREGISLSKTISSSTLKNSKTKSKLAERAIEAGADRVRVKKQFENAQKAERKPVNEFFNASNTSFANRNRKAKENAQKATRKPVNEFFNANNRSFANRNRKAKEKVDWKAAAKAAANRKAKEKVDWKASAKAAANRKAKEAKAAAAIRKAKENANRRKAAAAKAAANLKAKARAKNEERARQQAQKAKQLEEARKRELASRKRLTKKMKAKNRMKIKKRR